VLEKAREDWPAFAGVVGIKVKKGDFRGILRYRKSDNLEYTFEEAIQAAKGMMLRPGIDTRSVLDSLASLDAER